MSNEKLQNIKARFDHESAKQILKEKYEAKMLFAAYGGMWKAGPNLLSALALLPNPALAILIDEYGNPCQINASELYIKAQLRWQEQMNAWHREYEKLQGQR
jgi:hypothetical protein